MEPKRFAMAGEIKDLAQRHDIPEGSAFLQMDASIVPEGTFNQASWYRESFKTDGALYKHDSDEVLMFIGGDHSNKDDLGARLTFRIENDVFDINETCLIYIPAGAAHALVEIKDVKQPVLCTSYHYSAPMYAEAPAQATAPKGTYENCHIEGDHPIDERVIPPEVMDRMLRLLWVDGRLIPGAPYLESLWFAKAGQNGPPSHVHGFDEIIGFIGGDPANPQELNGYVEYDLGETTVKSDKSVFIIVPTGVDHSPIRMPKVDRPLFHFSGGGKTGYDREFIPGEDG